MAAIYPIATTTVGSGGSASIDFSSIPSTYTDLMLLISTRNWSAGSDFTSPLIKFNNSTANYDLKYLGFAAGSAVSYNYAVFGANIIGYQPGGTSTANSFMNTSIYIPNYAGSTNKSVSIDNVYSVNAATTGVYWGLSAGLWSQTAAINQLTLTHTNFVQYSTATLYGIK